MTEPAANDSSLPRRPGPFGPARDLIPRNQVVLEIPGEMPCGQAIERLADLDYSAAPVRENGLVRGVFTLREIGHSLLASEGMKVTELLAQPAASFTEDARFLDPDEWVDTTIDWRTHEWVLVGTPEVVEGVLTVTDVWAKLNDFAEAFVLLHEIELDIRELITMVLGPDLQTAIAGLATTGASFTPRRDSRELTDLTFDQYRQLILDGPHGWPRFETCFLRARTRLRIELESVRDIRNAAMHHRRPLKARDCAELRRFHRVLRNAIDRARS